jgi:formylmethanofuran--tetrahydromethanopterin N-formyltransferase
MPASTNHALCPTLKGTVPDSQVPDGVAAVYEIVINGIGEDSVKAAMRTGIGASCRAGGITHIGASNFGGKLGPFRFGLRELFGA